MIKSRELLQENSCLNKANSDEPIFVLLARDPCAAEIVRLWAYVRIGRGINLAGDEKIKSAMELADNMNRWADARNLPQ